MFSDTARAEHVLRLADVMLFIICALSIPDNVNVTKCKQCKHKFIYKHKVCKIHAIPVKRNVLKIKVNEKR